MLRRSAEEIVDAMARGRERRSERHSLPCINEFLSVLEVCYGQEVNYILGSWQPSESSAQMSVVIGRIVHSIHLQCANPHGSQSVFIPIGAEKSFAHAIAQTYVAFEQKRIRVTLDTQTLGYDALSGQTIDLRDLGQEIETLQEEETMGDLTPHEAHQRLIKKFHELRPVHPTTTGNIKGKIQPVWDEYPSFVQGLLEVPGEPGRVLLRAMQEAGCVGFRGDKVLVLTTPVSSEESKLTPKVGDVLPVILPDMVQWAVLNGEGAGKGVRRVTREDLQEEIDHHTQVYGISREGLVAELAHLSVLTLEGEGETYLFSIKAAKATLTGATSSTTQSSAEDDNVLLLADSEEDDDASDEGGGNLGGSGDDDEFSLVIEMAIESARQATGVAKSDPAPIHWKGGSVWQALVGLMDGDLLKTRSAMARFYREGYITVAGGGRVFLETPYPSKS